MGTHKPPVEIASEAQKLRASLQLIIEASEHLIAHSSETTVTEAVSVLANIAHAGLRAESDNGHAIALSDIERFIVPKSAKARRLDREAESLEPNGPAINI